MVCICVCVHCTYVHGCKCDDVHEQRSVGAIDHQLKLCWKCFSAVKPVWVTYRHCFGIHIAMVF